MLYISNSVGNHCSIKLNFYRRSGLESLFWFVTPFFPWSELEQPIEPPALMRLTSSSSNSRQKSWHDLQLWWLLFLLLFLQRNSLFTSCLVLETCDNTSHLFYSNLSTHRFSFYFSFSTKTPISAISRIIYLTFFFMIIQMQLLLWLLFLLFFLFNWILFRNENSVLVEEATVCRCCCMQIKGRCRLDFIWIRQRKWQDV